MINTKFKPKKLGVCACGADAFMKMSILLSPNKRTKPKPICDACAQKDRDAMLRRAAQLTKKGMQ